MEEIRGKRRKRGKERKEVRKRGKKESENRIEERKIEERQEREMGGKSSILTEEMEVAMFVISWAKIVTKFHKYAVTSHTNQF